MPRHIRGNDSQGTRKTPKRDTRAHYTFRAHTNSTGFDIYVTCASVHTLAVLTFDSLDDLECYVSDLKQWVWMIMVVLQEIKYT